MSLANINKKINPFLFNIKNSREKFYNYKMLLFYIFYLYITQLSFYFFYFSKSEILINKGFKGILLTQIWE